MQPLRPVVARALVVGAGSAVRLAPGGIPLGMARTAALVEAAAMRARATLAATLLAVVGTAGLAGRAASGRAVAGSVVLRRFHDSTGIAWD